MARIHYQQNPVCGGCAHFCRHYTKHGKSRFQPTCFRHCVHPRIKERRVDERCPNWTPIGLESQS